MQLNSKTELLLKLIGRLGHRTSRNSKIQTLKIEKVLTEVESPDAVRNRYVGYLNCAVFELTT